MARPRLTRPQHGRDSGEGSRISRDKVVKLSHVLVNTLANLRKEVELRFEKNDVRLEIIHLLTALFRDEEKIDRAVRQKILPRSLPIRQADGLPQRE